MPLTPGERDRLLLHLEASLAQRRRDRGLRLNAPEARALIADAICEWARDGLRWVDARDRARTLLTADDVLPGVPEAVGEIRVEARFDDGTRLVVVKDPFGLELPATNEESPPPPVATLTIAVTNEASTAIGITSHMHLAEVNPRLRLDRSAAFGMRPAVTTGETVWVLAGQTITIPARPIGGGRRQIGTTGLVDGDLDDPGVRERALAALRECGYLDIVDGQPVGDLAAAEDAVANVMRTRGAR